LLWQCELADAVPNNVDALYALAVNTFRLVNENLLCELHDDFSSQFLDVCVLAHQLQEGVHVGSSFRHCADGRFQLPDIGLKCFLFLLVTGGHPGKALVADFTINIVFVESLDDAVQLPGFGLFLFQLTFVIAQALIYLGLGLICHHMYKIILVLSGKGCDAAHAVK